MCCKCGLSIAKTCKNTFMAKTEVGEKKKYNDIGEQVGAHVAHELTIRRGYRLVVVNSFRNSGTMNLLFMCVSRTLVGVEPGDSKMRVVVFFFQTLFANMLKNPYVLLL